MAKSSSRGSTRVKWIVVHTAEGIRKASDLKAFFDRSTVSSAHAVADDSTLLDNLVPYERAAWTLRNGNEESDNLELCGFASWSRETWINEHHGMLEKAAEWIRSRCRARGIPMVKLSAADVRAGKSGVIGHVDYTNGMQDGTHWDPGPGFPWDVVMDLATSETEQEEDWMANVRIAKWSGGTAIFAVTPMGHWQFPNMQSVNDFAFKYNLPRDAAGNAIIESNDHTAWFGPNLSVLMNNAAESALNSAKAVEQTKPVEE